MKSCYAKWQHPWVCEKEPLTGGESFCVGRTFHIGGLIVETRLTCGHATGGATYFIRGLPKPVTVVGDSMFEGSMGALFEGFTIMTKI
jgi:glyoxylase-like metal-dependent hydrolase (beta-lactamase superfamily II)